MLRSLHFSKWKKLGAIGLGLVIASSTNLMAIPSLIQDAATGLYALQADNTSIKEILSYIEKNSDYIFVYSEGVNSQLSKKIDIDLKGKSMTQLLDEMYKKAGLAYTVNGRQVIISLPQSTQKKADKSYILKGQVVDTENEPLPGVNVTVASKKERVATDLYGNFRISVSPGDILTFSYLGFSNATVDIKGQNDISVTMEEATSNLDEVVVIGYGSMKKKDLTGSIVQIKPDNLAAEAPKTVQDLLRGTTGLSVGFSNSAKGGGAMSIRGQRSVYTDGNHNDPLIILDGMMFYGELSEINPNDIEQIDVLKDASSAAVYGARAANGVILITTKKVLRKSLL